jgi:hypothetical protein
LERTFQTGVADYCTYWFRKAANALEPGQRAGLVGTNSIAQGKGREATLDHVVASGGVITDAISSQKWPGEAKVHVAIVNWVHKPDTEPAKTLLDGTAVDGIAADLVPAALSTIGAQRLEANQGVCFQGPIPVGGGFVLSPDEAQELLARSDADYAQVVRPYLIGDDVTEDPEQRPRRWIIDFGLRELEEAEAFPAALDIVRARVKPERQTNNRKLYRENWWRFGENRPGMRRELQGLERYAVIGATGKRMIAVWAEASWCPSNAVYPVATDQDWQLGVLMSWPHTEWARRRGSSLKGDPRYTSTTVFETFPWPEPDADQRAAIAAAAQEVLAERAIACGGARGLTTVYNTMDDGGHRGLADAHRALDLAVLAAYGWPASSLGAPTEAIPRLMERNAAIAGGTVLSYPFPASTASSSPGVQGSMNL